MKYLVHVDLSRDIQSNMYKRDQYITRKCVYTIFNYTSKVLNIFKILAIMWLPSFVVNDSGKKLINNDIHLLNISMAYLSTIYKC